jgi:phosphatidate cytidylyltransferase
MFKTRLLSGIVLVILALFLIISGHEILLFATLAISCIGMFELYRVFKMEKTVLAGVGKSNRGCGGLNPSVPTY